MSSTSLHFMHVYAKLITLLNISLTHTHLQITTGSVSFVTLHFFRNEVAPYSMKYEQYILTFIFYFCIVNYAVILYNISYNMHMSCFKSIVNCKCKMKRKFLELLLNETHEQYILMQRSVAVSGQLL